MYEASILVIGLLLAVIGVIIGALSLYNSKTLMDRAMSENRSYDYEKLKQIKIISIILIIMSSLAIFLFVIIPVTSWVTAKCNFQGNVPVSDRSLYTRPVSDRSLDARPLDYMFNPRNC